MAVAAVSRVIPMSISIATSSAFSACGCLRKARRSTRTSDSICSLAVVTDVYSPNAIENAPANNPATPLSTTVCALALAADARDQAVLLTRPSIAPNVAARSQPPDTSECRWSAVCGTPVGRPSACPTRSWRRFNACRFRAGLTQVTWVCHITVCRGAGAGYGRVMATTAEHLRNTLDGRWRDVKNRMREELSNEVFRPHYTPNTVIARTKVAEQMKIMAANGAAEDGFKKEHGGNGDVGAAVTQIEMLAMSDLSLMVKAGVQWGLFGGAIENLGTERHHEAYVQRIIDLDLLGCFAMTETGHGSDVQALETTATYDPATQEFVIDSPTRTSRKDYIGGAAETATSGSGFRPADHPRRRRATACTASSCRSATTRATTCRA